MSISSGIKILAYDVVNGREKFLVEFPNGRGTRWVAQYALGLQHRSEMAATRLRYLNDSVSQKRKNPLKPIEIQDNIDKSEEGKEMESGKCRTDDNCLFKCICLSTRSISPLIRNISPSIISETLKCITCLMLSHTSCIIATRMDIISKECEEFQLMNHSVNIELANKVVDKPRHQFTGSKEPETHNHTQSKTQHSHLEIRNFVCPFCRIKSIDSFEPLHDIITVFCTPLTKRNLLMDGDSSEGTVSVKFSLTREQISKYQEENILIGIRCILSDPYTITERRTELKNDVTEDTTEEDVSNSLKSSTNNQIGAMVHPNLTNTKTQAPMWPESVSCSVNNKKDVFRLNPPKYGHVRREVCTKSITDLVTIGTNSVTIKYTNKSIGLKDLGIRDGFGLNTQLLIKSGASKDNNETREYWNRYIFSVVAIGTHSADDIISEFRSNWKFHFLEANKWLGIDREIVRIGSLSLQNDQDDTIQILNNRSTRKHNVINTMCPLSFRTIQTPVRSKDCCHLNSFDFDAFIRTNAGTGNIEKRWRCPICMRRCEVSHLIVDSFIFAIIRKLECSDWDILTQSNREDVSDGNGESIDSDLMRVLSSIQRRNSKMYQISTQDNDKKRRQEEIVDQKYTLNEYGELKELEEEVEGVADSDAEGEEIGEDGDGNVFPGDDRRRGEKILTVILDETVPSIDKYKKVEQEMIRSRNSICLEIEESEGSLNEMSNAHSGHFIARDKSKYKMPVMEIAEDD